MLNMGLPQQAWVEKTIHGVETHWLSGKKNIRGAAISKDNANSFMGHERIPYYWFLWKECDYKQYFLLPTPKAKFTLLIEKPSYKYTMYTIL